MVCCAHWKYVQSKAIKHGIEFSRYLMISVQSDPHLWRHSSSFLELILKTCLLQEIALSAPIIVLSYFWNREWMAVREAWTIARSSPAARSEGFCCICIAKLVDWQMIYIELLCQLFVNIHIIYDFTPELDCLPSWFWNWIPHCPRVGKVGPAWWLLSRPSEKERS